MKADDVETGVLKQGKESCGVSRQYTGSAGKVTNSQIGVFACYVSGRGHAFIDRELYLPKSWTDDKARMAKAHVPQELIDRAIAANVPFSFVAANTVYGVGDIEMAERRAGAVAETAKEIADRLPLSTWKRLSAGAGTKGERQHGWAYLELADLEGVEYDEALDGQVWTRGLLISRKIVDGDFAFFTTWRQVEPRSKRWRKSKAIGGRSRTVLKSQRTSWASITTRRAPGMDGDVMSRSSCWLSP